jgi:hypothetical protein
MPRKLVKTNGSSSSGGGGSSSSTYSDASLLKQADGSDSALHGASPDAVAAQVMCDV